MKKSFALQAFALAALMNDKSVENPYFKKDNSTKSLLPYFKVNDMEIQAVNEQTAIEKYNKIISKKNRKNKRL